MYELGTLRHTQRMCTTIISSALRFAIKVRSAMFRALHHPVGRGPHSAPPWSTLWPVRSTRMLRVEWTRTNVSESGCADDCCTTCDATYDVTGCISYCGEALETLHHRTLIVYLGIVPVLCVLPLMVVCCCVRLGLCSSRAKGNSIVITSAANTPEEKLASAEKAAARLRARVGGSVASLGWLFLILGLSPVFINSLDYVDVSLTTGFHRLGWCAFFPWGLVLLALAIRPIDSFIIRWCAIGLFWFDVFCAMFFAFVGWRMRSPDGSWEEVRGSAFLAAACIPAFCALLLSHTFRRGGCCSCLRNFRSGASSTASDAMPGRLQLLRVWLTLRIFFAMGGLITLYGTLLNSPLNFRGGARNGNTGALLIAVNMFAVTVLSSRRMRGKVVRSLGSLGEAGSKEQAAASIAALLGKNSGAEALAAARQHFRALPLSSLSIEEMQHNKPDPAMHAKTVQARLGAIEAFVSHSWSDEGEAKFECLQAWGALANVTSSNATGAHIWLGKCPRMPAKLPALLGP